MMENSQNYKGIDKNNSKSLNQILSYIGSDPNTTKSMIVLIWKIHLLSLKNGYCSMSNNNLGKELNLSKSSVIKGINDLYEEGYIKREHNESVTSRKIYIQYDNPKFNYTKDENETETTNNIDPIEESNESGKVENQLEHSTNDVTKDTVQPPTGITGLPLVKPKTKSKSKMTANEQKLYAQFNELVFNKMPAPVVASLSAKTWFNKFMLLSDEDRKMMLRNTEEYVQLQDPLYTVGMKKYFDEKRYSDDYLDAMRRRQEAYNNKNKQNYSDEEWIRKVNEQDWTTGI